MLKYAPMGKADKMRNDELGMKSRSSGNIIPHSSLLISHFKSPMGKADKMRNDELGIRNEKQKFRKHNSTFLTPHFSFQIPYGKGR